MKVIKELKRKLSSNQINFYDYLKRNDEDHLKIINKLKEEISGLKTKLLTNEELPQNKTNKPIADKEVPNNEFICNSIESIYFGTFKTTLRCFEVYQDSFKLNYFESNKTTPSLNKVVYHLTLFFNACEECMYCNDPSLRIIIIRPNKTSGLKIKKNLGLDDKFDSIYKSIFNVDSICQLISLSFN